MTRSRPLQDSAEFVRAGGADHPGVDVFPETAENRKAGGGGTSDIALAAEKTYVAPGDLDEYYMFSSGGHSGQIYVYGLPSMRHHLDDSGVHAVSGNRLRIRR